MNRRPVRCAACNFHLQSFAKRHAELYGVGVREVVFFQSRTMYAVGESAHIEQTSQEGSE